MRIDFMKKNYIRDHISINVSCVSRIYWKFIACEKFLSTLSQLNFLCFDLDQFWWILCKYWNRCEKVLIMRHVNFLINWDIFNPSDFVTVMTMSLFALRLYVQCDINVWKFVKFNMHEIFLNFLNSICKQGKKCWIIAHFNAD